MCWFITHLCKRSQCPTSAGVATYEFAFMQFCRSMFPSARGADSCKVSDAGKSPLPLQRLTLRPTDVSLLGINEKYSSFGSKRCRCLGTEDLIYCSLSTTVLLVSLALVWKLLKVSEKSPRGCRLRLIGGATGPSACLSWFAHGAEANRTVRSLLLTILIFIWKTKTAHYEPARLH